MHTDSIKPSLQFPCCFVVTKLPRDHHFPDVNMVYCIRQLESEALINNATMSLHCNIHDEMARFLTEMFFYIVFILVFLLATSAIYMICSFFIQN
jgi:hypothetical protein